MTVALLTNGWVCYARRTFVRRFVLPMTLCIKSSQSLILQILNITKLNLNLNQIVDKNINLKLNEKNINIKPSNIINIGVNKCFLDS
jgi:hypothetical protein